eukprot:TRINITY_DN2686_c0_g1_i2.p1 TRINITY_DN2686_c0_g1~~TRINITY_DN2686_c0_g1_i2.p1  ORF type:complete len:150 (-),score=13.84 TRINITY_DN2686_c0_g1_i2:23-472(-)
MEACFAWMSIVGQVATSDNFMAPLWREYGNADSRWLYSDPTIVSIELITAAVAGPLCVLMLYAMTTKKRYRHFWQIVLCTMELYGGYMTFCPEWLTGSKALNTENPLYNIVYLWFFNGLWVVIPLLLLYQSYLALTAPSRIRGISKKKR